MEGIGLMKLKPQDQVKINETCEFEKYRGLKGLVIANLGAGMVFVNGPEIQVINQTNPYPEFYLNGVPLLESEVDLVGPAVYNVTTLGNDE